MMAFISSGLLSMSTCHVWTILACPTAIHRTRLTLGVKLVAATRGIQAGEEITVPYLNCETTRLAHRCFQFVCLWYQSRFRQGVRRRKLLNRCSNPGTTINDWKYVYGVSDSEGYFLRLFWPIWILHSSNGVFFFQGKLLRSFCLCEGNQFRLNACLDDLLTS